MGGIGSTRWDSYQKKPTAEDCLKLSMADLRAAYGNFASQWVGTEGILTWSSGAEIGYRLDASDNGLHMTFTYLATVCCEKRFKNLVVLISTTHCHYGGKRYWFHCPRCQYRVTKLYLLLGDFACRHCHSLTYTSTQQAHRYDRMARSIGVNLAFLDHSFRVDSLMQRWYNKDHLTRGERYELADALGLPVSKVRNKWFQPKTRLKMFAANAKGQQ